MEHHTLDSNLLLFSNSLCNPARLKGTRRLQVFAEFLKIGGPENPSVVGQFLEGKLRLKRHREETDEQNGECPNCIE